MIKETAMIRSNPEEDIMVFMRLWVGTGGEGTGMDTNQRAGIQCRWYCTEPTVSFSARLRSWSKCEAKRPPRTGIRTGKG